jgi:hypothetical protein
MVLSQTARLVEKAGGENHIVLKRLEEGHTKSGLQFISVHSIKHEIDLY